MARPANQPVRPPRTHSRREGVLDLNNLADGLRRPSYRTYWTKMGSHKRLISAPNESMEELHRRFIAYLRGHPVMDLLWLRHSSASPGRGWVENAKRVRFCRYFYKTDISSAFESIRLEQLVWALQHTVAGIGETEGTLPFEWEANVAGFLERWCMNDPRQGSTGLRRGPNSSPLLTEILFALLFDHPVTSYIKEYCFGKNPPDRPIHPPISYARYVDDFVLGMHQMSPLPWKFLHRRIRESGFRVNHKKTHVLDIERHPVIITGVGIAPGGRLYIPRSLVARARLLMHPRVMSGKLDREAHLEIKGLMEAFHLVTNENGAPYNMTEAKLHWLYEIYKLVHLMKRGRSPEDEARIGEGVERIRHCADGNATEIAQLLKLYTDYERRRLKRRRRNPKIQVG